MNIRNKKWLLFAGYNLRKEYIHSFLDHVGKSLDKLIGDNNNLIIIGDFNSQVEEYVMEEFGDTYNVQNLILELACFKNVQNPTIIDMILTNKTVFKTRFVLKLEWNVWPSLYDCNSFKGSL